MSSTAAAAPAVPAKKGKLFLVIGAVTVLAAGGAGGAWWLQKNKQTQGADTVKKVEHKPRVFAPLDPFTLNLRNTGTEHFLQIGITFETTGTPIADAIKTFTPLIRSRVLYLLTSKSADDISTIEGKIKLAGELLAVVRQGLASAPAAAEAGPDHGVTDVHFSSFIIQ